MIKKAIQVTLFSLALSISSIPVSSGILTKAENVSYTPTRIEYVDTRNDNKKDIIFYSDEYFKHSSTEFDEHLATLSMMSSRYSMNPGGPGSIDNDEYYYDQPLRLNYYLRAIGFINFSANEDYHSRTGLNTIGIGVASRQIDDFTVISLTPRSGGYYNEWSDNVMLGKGDKSDMMHEGWYNAAKKAIDHLAYFIKNTNVNGKIKLWFSGFSRGGAVVNIAGALIDNYIENGTISDVLGNVTLNHDDLFVYTFEAPQGANLNSKTVKSPKDKIYNNIFNIVNPNDLVPKVAMHDWGFTRFGIDKYVSTEFFDPDNFKAYRETFKKFYTDDFSGDDFTTYKGTTIADWIPFINGNTIFGTIAERVTEQIMDRTTKLNYDANIVSNLFLETAVEVVGSRDDYVDKYQDTAMKAIWAFIADVKGVGNEPKLLDFINTLIFLALGKFFAPEDIINSIDYLSVNYSTEIMPIVKVALEIITKRTEDSFSFIKNIGNMFDNHGTDVSIAFMKSQDSFYIDDYNSINKTNIKKAPLRNDSSYWRLFHWSFNDVEVYRINNDKSKTEVAYVEGSRFTKSNVKYCNKGYAIGYYRYGIVDEDIEVFIPANQNIEVYSTFYSLMPACKIRMLPYLYNTNNLHEKTEGDKFTYWANFGYGPLVRNYKPI